MKNSICDQMTKACQDIKNDDMEHFSDNFLGRMQKHLWDTMENPEANIVAKFGNNCSFVSNCQAPTIKF